MERELAQLKMYMSNVRVHWSHVEKHRNPLQQDSSLFKRQPLVTLPSSSQDEVVNRLTRVSPEIQLIIGKIFELEITVSIVAGAASPLRPNRTARKSCRRGAEAQSRRREVRAVRGLTWKLTVIQGQHPPPAAHGSLQRYNSQVGG